jgi:hypothetical protein
MKYLIKSLDQAIGDLYLMKAPITLVEKYFDQEIMFNLDDKTYLWQGDFSIASELVIIDKTHSFSCLQDQSETELTDRLIYLLRYEILNNH